MFAFSYWEGSLDIEIKALSEQQRYSEEGEQVQQGAQDLRSIQVMAHWRGLFKACSTHVARRLRSPTLPDPATILLDRHNV